MKLYYNGELIHVDGSAEIIEHFGVKGMKWGIRSRHRSLKDSYDYYKETNKQATDFSLAAATPSHRLYNYARAKVHEAAANKAIYKSQMYDTLLKEKIDRAKRRGKKIKNKVAKKLQDKSDNSYYDYLANNKLSNQYYDKHNNSY